MAVAKGTTKSNIPRKRVGASKAKKATAAKASATRRTVNVQAPTPAQVDAKKQAAADLEQKVFVAGNVDSFQLRAERRRKDEDGFIEVVPGKDLVLRAGAVEVDDETLQIVENVLEGRHSDGNVDARHFQKIARTAGLRIIRPGLVRIPLKTWNDLPDAEVVQVALKSGALASREDVVRAIGYEQQAPLRTPRREPRELVIEHLEIVLDSLGGEDDDEVDAYVADELPVDAQPIDVAVVPLAAEGEEL